VQFTRARAYQKNDNAHIENKNWTHVRQYIGYQRFDHPPIVEWLNQLYTTEWRLYFNYFMPSVKLIEKERIGAKINKKYDQPKTPVERLLESDDIPEETKQALRTQWKALNPFQLQKQISRKIKTLLKYVETLKTTAEK